MSRIDSALAFLADLPDDARIAVGFSGGLDSLTLLHEVRQRLPQRAHLRALHVHHGLHEHADRWQRFCREHCQCERIPLEVLRVAPPATGASLENRARLARYRAFAKALQSGELLLLAHHLDDQVETLLLRLLRGAGPPGLSGIPARRSLGQGALLRPFLQLPRSELESHARSQGLDWIDDESNRDTRFDRNYCRHAILPLLEERWPRYRESWERSRGLLAESRQLLDELARLDLASCAAEPASEGEPSPCAAQTSIDELRPGEKLASASLAAPASPACLADLRFLRSLQIEPLQRLSEPRRRNALRCWLECHGESPPEAKRLHELAGAVLASRSDGAAAVAFTGFQVRRFAGELHFLPDLPRFDELWQADWNPAKSPLLELPGNGSLHAIATNEQGLAAASYQIRYRQGGETCRLANRRSRKLKKILNEARIPPWLRKRLPLLFAGSELAAIPGIGIAESASAQPGYRIEWRHDSTCTIFHQLRQS